MKTRRKASGTFALPTSASNAISFFTPEGERVWEPGWSPTYPGGVSEEPGTVFVTTTDGIETLWVIVMIDRTNCVSAYARITPDHHAGTVRVHCSDRSTQECIVTVEYDMTSLNPNRPEMLNGYDEDSFIAMMTEWANEVTAALALGHYA